MMTVIMIRITPFDCQIHDVGSESETSNKELHALSLDALLQPSRPGRHWTLQSRGEPEISAGMTSGRLPQALQQIWLAGGQTR